MSHSFLSLPPPSSHWKSRIHHSALSSSPFLLPSLSQHSITFGLHIHNSFYYYYNYFIFLYLYFLYSRLNASHPLSISSLPPIAALLDSFSHRLRSLFQAQIPLGFAQTHAMFCHLYNPYPHSLPSFSHCVTPLSPTHHIPFQLHTCRLNTTGL